MTDMFIGIWHFFNRLLSGQQPDTPTPSCILVRIKTSGPTLSKSDPSAFSITMEATTDTTTPITASVESSLLDTKYLTLCDRGLTFRDLKTGELAPMNVMNICRMGTDGFPKMTTNNTVEIPPMGSEKPYTVTHHFAPPQSLESCDQMAESFMKILKPMDPSEEAAMVKARERRERLGLTPAEELQQRFSQGGGFTAGRSYEIGLGTDLSHITWWRNGGKKEVFASGKPIYRGVHAGEKLHMRLAESASFEVVP